MDLVSVIIPVYNVEAYLRQALESVLSQSYGNLEIIIVNDGSTDGCQDIINKYASTDSRIKAFEKTNGGLSDARNFGMDRAKGDWIFFLDSDDYLTTDAIERLLAYAKDNNCDAVQGGFYYYFADHLDYDNRWIDEQYKATLKNKAMLMSHLIDNNFIKNFAWGKLYRTSLIKDLYFVKGVYFEDSYWQHLVLDRVNRFGILGYPIYYYRQRQGSISGNANDKILDLLRGNEQRMLFIQKKYPELYSKAVKSYWSSLVEICWPQNEQSIAKLEYWNCATNQYKSLFDKHLKRNLQYWLIKNNSSGLLNFLFLIKRLNNHLFAKRLKTIR